MVRYLISIVFGVFLSCNLIACGTDDSSISDRSDGTKYLSKNIIFNSGARNQSNAAPSHSSEDINPFNFNLTQSAYAQSIDTETQIMAENVIFENVINSNIASDNVQDALEEITLVLSEAMIGTWKITNLDDDLIHDPTGIVKIYDDGTFDLIEGSLAAIGMGSSGLCEHDEENQTYEVHTDELIQFTHYNGTTKNSVIPLLVKLRQDEIILMGSGGCGKVPSTRFSILSRVIQ